MNNYNWESFNRKIAIKTDLSVLYDAWTIPDEIEKWFLSKADYKNSKGELINRTANVQEGDHYAWSWYSFDVVEEGRILEANGKDRLQFSFAGDCNVEVKFYPEREYTMVELTHSNIPTDNQSKRNIRIGCDLGWCFFLVNLKSFYEGGMDLRNKDENLKGMVNN